MQQCVGGYVCSLIVHFLVSHQIPSVVLQSDNLPVNGQRSVNDLSKRPPFRVHRARIFMSATKTVMDVQWSNTQIYDTYNFRVTWSEPLFWNDDKFTDESGDRRRYELECWMTEVGNKNTKTLFRKNITWHFNGYFENLRFPQDLELSAQCKVRALNSFNVSSQWKHTNKINVTDVPIYLAGFEGVNLRGLSRQDILSVLEKIAKEAAHSQSTDS